VGDALLRVEGVAVVFESPGGPVVAVDDVSFEIQKGETLGLVGESGCGKSVTAFAIVRLLPPGARTTAGRVWFNGKDLLSLPESEMRRVRGADIGFVFQEPTAALNPVMRVGAQVAESMIVHGLVSKRDAFDRAVDLLRAVHIREPELRAREYPHQLSGGMQQRVMLAIALACRPSLLIADEPTTALDVTIQAQILDLLRELKQQFDLSVLLITHDLGVVAETADRVAVMHGGKIVEQGSVRDILRRPSHPYTQQLLAATPGAVRATVHAGSHESAAPAED
jgi:ABC-type dipeptide/oligopeptide/nickel transport system ATPase component